MNAADLQSFATVLAFIAFAGLCLWAFSRRRKAAFDEAARLPFADEPPTGQNASVDASKNLDHRPEGGEAP